MITIIQKLVLSEAAKQDSKIIIDIFVQAVEEGDVDTIEYIAATYIDLFQDGEEKDAVEFILSDIKDWRTKQIN